MREDPVARRNRSTMLGVWVLGGLAALIVLLVAIDLLRPAPTSALVEPAATAAPVSMKQRVANEEIEAVQRERNRAHP